MQLIVLPRQGATGSSPVKESAGGGSVVEEGGCELKPHFPRIPHNGKFHYVA